MPDNPSLAKHPNLDDWLSIGADGTVAVRSGKVDIGQRISDAVARIVAAELDLELPRIDVVRRETGISPDEGYTSGSNSMEETGEALRLVAATARAYLLARAGEALEVEPASLDVADGLIRSRATNRSVSYWELLGGQPFGIPIDSDADVKPAEAYKRFGSDGLSPGMAALVTGAQKFIHDMTMPGMLHARLVRPPHYRARLSGFDEAIVARFAGEGLQVVRDGSFLAVAGADEYAVIKGAERLSRSVTWDERGGLDDRDPYERLVANTRISLPVVDGIPREEPVPELPSPPDNAALTHSARYERPYHMHGSIGPSAGLALFEDGRLTLWMHGQGIYPMQASIAEALGLAVENVHLIHGPGAGNYGHNGSDDAAFDAALIAKHLPGTPVLLKWSREDEHAWEPYSSAMVMDLSASLDDSGAVIAWSHESYSDCHIARPRPGPGNIGPSRLLSMQYVGEPLEPPPPPPNMTHHGGIHRNAEPLYAFANQRIVKHLVRELPLRVSTLRTLGAYANVFALESFLDELAEQAGLDPLEFRLRHLEDERAGAVLRATADRFGWRRADRPANVGHGIAFAQYKNVKAYGAAAVELEVDETATVRLRRVVLGVDAGQIVDPDALAAQLEGGFLQAASWTLYEAVRFDAHGITSRDWESYPILRFDNVPEIETVLIDRPGDPFLGAGEATCGPAAGAIANAIYDAAGLRLRRLPFTPDAIRAAALA